MDDKQYEVIPGGFRNIRLAVWRNERSIHHPHFHFYRQISPTTDIPNNGRGGGCILINKPLFYNHGSHQDRLNYIELKALKKFLNSKYPDHEDSVDLTIWQYIVGLYSRGNGDIDIFTEIPEYFHNMQSVNGDAIYKARGAYIGP